MKEIKKIIQKKYGEIANHSKKTNEQLCCGIGPECCGTTYSNFSDSYENTKGYLSDADLGLGCGLPTQFLDIRQGDTVVDLGSGAGNDCFVAHAQVGEQGRVIGIDFTPEMIEKAEKNKEKLGYANVEFRFGEIEEIPLDENQADAVISNCVLNLVPDKKKAFSEIYRILKSGGRFSISDVVLNGELPAPIKEAAEMYAGCVAGACLKTEYLSIIEQTGFKNISVKKEKVITIPDELLLKYLSQQELIHFKKTKFGIFSITVYAEKL